MTSLLMPWAVTIVGAIVGAVLLFAGRVALVRRRSMARLALRTSAGMTAWLTSGLVLTSVMTFGSFKALSNEEVAASIDVEPRGDRTFVAIVSPPSGQVRAFELAGDQLFVDAMIVKWHPIVNALGFHTAYRLDRIGGRYRSIELERTAPRTVEALHDDRRSIAMAERIADTTWLKPIVDAQYGSGTFADATKAATYEVRVSTSGLLLRPVQR